MLAAVALGLPAAASATNTSTFKPTFVPISKFPGTGTKLGAGTAVQAKLVITHSPGGKECPTETLFNIPCQLRKVVVYLPKGFGVELKGFATCSTATLEVKGAAGCPKNAIASPVGSALVSAPIGGEEIKEKATLQAFVAPNNGLNFFSVGVTPIAAEVISPGHFEPASGQFSKKLVTEVPEVASVPGAPNASIDEVNVKVGAAIKKGKKIIYGATIPKKCPKGGFPWKAELTYENGETSVSTTKTPCLKK